MDFRTIAQHAFRCGPLAQPGKTRPTHQPWTLPRPVTGRGALPREEKGSDSHSGVVFGVGTDHHFLGDLVGARPDLLFETIGGLGIVLEERLRILATLT